MISYAQNFEDVVLNRVFHDVPVGRYIDVGAYDPVQDSVTKHFYDRGWSGVNVEPVQRFHAAFEKQRPRDWNLNVVLGQSPGVVEFNARPPMSRPISDFRSSEPPFANVGIRFPVRASSACK